MTGWFVVNHFVISNYFGELFGLIERSAARHGVELARKTNKELLCAADYASPPDFGPLPDFVLFWDKDIHLARYLERLGLRLFNSADAIGRCDDKALTHILLSGRGIPMPATVAAPKTYAGLGYADYAFLSDVENRLGFPMVVKECFGSFGYQVHLAKDHGELLEIVRRLGIKPMLFQAFVASSSGRDMRVILAGGRLVAAMRRYSTNGDFRANMAGGARAEPCEPTAAQLDIALAAYNALGLDFAGVDFLFGENDETLLCEVNSNVHFTGLYKYTGINAADAIFEHIIETVGKR